MAVRRGRPGAPGRTATDCRRVWMTLSSGAGLKPATTAAQSEVVVAGFSPRSRVSEACPVAQVACRERSRSPRSVVLFFSHHNEVLQIAHPVIDVFQELEVAGKLPLGVG